MIGRQEHSFQEPLGLIGDCHRRIERFLETMQRLATAHGGTPLAEPARTALQRVLTYFHTAAPRHTADEEQSLFPRLSRHPAAAQWLDALPDEHRQLDALQADMLAIGDRWLDTGSLPEADRQRLTILVTELQGLYGRHIALEDKQLLPLAAELLSPADLVAIGREMAARRGLDYDALAAWT